MRTFQSFTLVRQPVDAMWSAMRDCLGDIAAAMEEVKGIELIERSVESDGISLLQRWTMKQSVPIALRPMLGGGDSITWLDRAFWREDEKVCDWSIEPADLGDQVECGGRTYYESAMAGRGTRVRFEGYFDLKSGSANPLKLAIEPRVTGFVESFVNTVIPANLGRAVVAAGDFVRASNTPDCGFTGQEGAVP